MLQVKRFFRQSRTLLLLYIVAVFGNNVELFFVEFRPFNNVETN